MSDHFVVGKEYEIVKQFGGIILDPNNPDEPHPMYKDNPEECLFFHLKGSKFIVVEIREIIENDEWPLPDQSPFLDVTMENCTGYHMKVKFPHNLVAEGTVYLTSAMLGRKDIVEVDHTRLN